MTIDAAIAHYEWAAENAIGEVANESKQMAEWLRQARDAEKYKAERNFSREQLSESRRANEHLFIDIKRYRSILRAKLAAMSVLSNENAKLRELATDACTALRNHYDKDWFDGTVFAERMRKLGVEVTR